MELHPDMSQVSTGIFKHQKENNCVYFLILFHSSKFFPLDDKLDVLEMFSKSSTVKFTDCLSRYAMNTAYDTST